MFAKDPTKQMHAEVAHPETIRYSCTNCTGNCYGLAAASNKSATRPPLPPPGCGGEWKETGRNWWVGIRAV